MRGVLNLASQPARNDTLPNALFGLAAVGLLGLSLWHGVELWRLRPGGTGALHAEVASLSSEREELRAAARDLRVPPPKADTLAEWRVVKELVDRRTFSWSRLLSRVGGLLPPGVRLLSLSPGVTPAGLRIEISALARTRQEGFELVRALREKGGFADVFPLSVSSSARGEEFAYSLLYVPEPAPEASPAASSGGGAP